MDYSRFQEWCELIQFKSSNLNQYTLLSINRTHICLNSKISKAQQCMQINKYLIKKHTNHTTLYTIYVHITLWEWHTRWSTDFERSRTSTTTSSIGTDCYLTRCSTRDARFFFCNFYFLFYSINPQWMCPTDNKQPSKWCVCVDALLSYRTHTHLPLAHNPIGFVTRTHNHINAHTQPSATVIKVLHMGMVARVFAQWLNKLHEQANARPPPSHLHISRN